MITRQQCLTSWQDNKMIRFDCVNCRKTTRKCSGARDLVSLASTHPTGLHPWSHHNHLFVPSDSSAHSQTLNKYHLTRYLPKCQREKSPRCRETRPTRIKSAKQRTNAWRGTQARTNAITWRRWSVGCTNAQSHWLLGHRLPCLSQTKYRRMFRPSQH